MTGQYARGAIDGEPVPGYVEEIGHESRTETFVALKAHIDNWRWKGVPFYLRTGKRMPERDTEIFIQFKDVPYSIFASRGATTRPNKLIIGLQPEETISLHLMSKTPGLDRGGVRLREVPLDIGLANAFSEYRRRIAYERLLLDLIEGDPTLFVRRDEVEAQWTWIDRIRDAWAREGDHSAPLCGGHLGPFGGDRADRARRRSAGTSKGRLMPLNPTIAAGHRPDHRAVEADPPALSRADGRAEGARASAARACQLRQFRARLRRFGRGQGGDQPRSPARTSASSPPTTTCSRRISPTAAIPSR